jgi:hypothetical protein
MMLNKAKYKTLSSQDASKVRRELALILDSSFFRGSQRASAFIAYTVEQMLSGCQPSDLKERTLGIEVFQRPLDYDTSQDNIVRVTAYDVRKRLAQYYGSCTSTHEVVFHLPPGSYAVAVDWAQKKDLVPDQSEVTLVERSRDSSFSSPASSPALNPRPSETSRGTWFWFSLSSGMLTMALLAWGVAWLSHTWREPSPKFLLQVWEPILSNRRPVLICIAQPVAYLPPSNEVLDPGPEPRRGTFLLSKGAFVGVGDAYALADVAGFLGSQGKPWRLLGSQDAPVQDLKSGPVILIGAYSNTWSTDLTAKLRFVFADNTTIRDLSTPGRVWQLTNRGIDWKTTEDYAIVTRLTSSDTGEPIFVVAGLSNAGTQAAAEFLTDPNHLAAAMSGAPATWEQDNFQFVLHTRVIGETPEHTTVVARYFW